MEWGGTNCQRDEVLGTRLDCFSHEVLMCAWRFFFSRAHVISGKTVGADNKLKTGEMDLESHISL